VERAKIKMGKNQSCGQIEIPTTLPEGNYALRAYTTAMYGLPHDYFFKKEIYIVSSIKAEKRNSKHFSANKPNNLSGNNSQLSVEWKDENLRVSVNPNDMAPLYLLIHTRGMAHYLSEWKKTVNTLVFPKQNFPSGIVQVILLDESYNPLNEKMLFCQNDDRAHLSLLSERKDSLLKINILLTDSNEQPIRGNFSVSVSNDKFTTIDSGINISDYLLLTSDLKEKNDSLDSNFVSSENWKRYNIPQIIKGKMDTLPGFIELGQSVSGAVRNVSGKKVLPNAEVNILSLQTRYADKTTTDDNGKFVFNSLNFPNNTEFVIQAYNSKKKSSVSLSVDEDDFPTVEPIDLPSEIDSIIVEKAIQNAQYDSTKAIQLSEVIVKARKHEKPADPYSALADISFDSKKIEELNATCIHELLRRIAGVQVVGDNVIIRGASSIYGNSYAAIAIDGVLVSTINEDGTATNEFDLDVIDMPDVERVDVFKGGSSVIWGYRGGNGVISITTKKGNFDHSSVHELRYNTKRIKPLGYVQPAKFSQQPNGALIYWNPNVNTDTAGETSIEFSIPKISGAYSVLIQGITDEGLIIHKIEKLCIK
jgi:TonB-dependent SusC/RagA subfamily outer membrane receptor